MERETAQQKQADASRLKPKMHKREAAAVFFPNRVKGAAALRCRRYRFQRRAAG
jgi:hypothetical protein